METKRRNPAATKDIIPTFLRFILNSAVPININVNPNKNRARGRNVKFLDNNE